MSGAFNFAKTQVHTINNMTDAWDYHIRYVGDADFVREKVLPGHVSVDQVIHVLQRAELATEERNQEKEKHAGRLLRDLIVDMGACTLEPEDEADETD